MCGGGGDDKKGDVWARFNLCLEFFDLLDGVGVGGVGGIKTHTLESLENSRILSKAMVPILSLPPERTCLGQQPPPPAHEMIRWVAMGWGITVE